MTIYYPAILEEATEWRPFGYEPRDAILYALAIGMADEADGLNYVYERDLKVLPTAATVLGGVIMPRMNAPTGLRPSRLDMSRVVHGEQCVTLHRPLRASEALRTRTRTIGAYDKGAGRGALLITETDWQDDKGAPVATLTNSFFARGDGGFGGAASAPREEDNFPSRRADLEIVIPTRPDQALLYRLNGDMNPLHADPAAARKVGFDAPILHGLCTFGITCRAVLAAVPDADPDAIRSHGARFSAPVYPGETLVVSLWHETKELRFTARAADRDIEVISKGRTTFRTASIPKFN